MLLFLKINTFPRAHNPFQTLFFLLLFFCKLTPKLSLFPFSAFSSPLLTHSNWPFHPSIPLKVLPLCPIHSLGLCSHLAQPSAALDATGHSLLLEYHLLFSRLWYDLTPSSFPPDSHHFLKFPSSTSEYRARTWLSSLLLHTALPIGDLNLSRSTSVPMTPKSIATALIFLLHFWLLYPELHLYLDI